MKIIKFFFNYFFESVIFILITFLITLIFLNILKIDKNEIDQVNNQIKKEFINVGNDKQLFIDNKFVEKSNNLHFVVNRPQKIDHQVIRSELDWEAFRIIYFSIIEDNNIYKMWYQAYDKDQWDGGVPRMGYAYSYDGFNWIKPNLGLIEYNGSKNNNIILEGHKLSYVFKDKQNNNKSEKFKMIYGFPETRIATSPDGIKWNIAAIENSWKLTLKINNYQSNEDHRGYGVNFVDRNKLYRFTFSREGVHYLNTNQQYRTFGDNFHTSDNEWNTFVFEYKSKNDLCDNDKYENKIKLTINDKFHHKLDKANFPYKFSEPKISFGSSNTKGSGKINFNKISLQIVDDENLSNCKNDRWRSIASHIDNNNPEDEGWSLDKIGKETLNVYPDQDNENKFWSVQDTGDKSEGEYFISPLIRSDEVVYVRDWDTQKLAYWDESVKKYKIYLRSQITNDGHLEYPFVKSINSTPEIIDPKLYRPTRAIGVIEQEDIFKKWELNNFKTIMTADEHDPKNSDIYYFGGLYKYPYAEDAYFAFPSVYQHFEKYFIGDQEFANDGVLDIQFAASRNGINWMRYDRQSFIKRGLPGEKDFGLTFPTGYFFRAGNYLYQYYRGWPWTHQSYRTLSDEQKKNQTNWGKGFVGLVKHRLDGFVSLDANIQEGSFITPLLKFKGDELFLNIDVSAMGYVRVSILDENNRELKKFSLSKSDKIVTNDTEFKATWKANSDLSSIKDKKIKLKFILKSAKIYSFQFK